MQSLRGTKREAADEFKAAEHESEGSGPPTTSSTKENTYLCRVHDYYKYGGYWRRQKFASQTYQINATRGKEGVSRFKYSG